MTEKTNRTDTNSIFHFYSLLLQASWHPGNKTHQWVARKLSLLFLHALEEAINVWEKAASTDGNPLPGKYWHLSAEEKVIRDKLLNVDLNSTGESLLCMCKINCIDDMHSICSCLRVNLSTCRMWKEHETS